MKSVLALVLGGLVALSVGSGDAWGQATWGAISGFVNDASGAAIAGANVTATEVKTGVVTKGATDASGLYNVTHLLPGDYTVSVEAQGFKRFTQEHVNLQVDSTVRVDCALQLGPVTQQITVEAAVAQLQTEKTDVARNINEQTV